jgi:hypothetical protein
LELLGDFHGHSATVVHTRAEEASAAAVLEARREKDRERKRRTRREAKYVFCARVLRGVCAVTLALLAIAIAEHGIAGSLRTAAEQLGGLGASGTGMGYDRDSSACFPPV